MQVSRFYQNIARLFSNPGLALDFIGYIYSKVRHQGKAVRHLYKGASITGFSGFSEYHSCAEFVEAHEYAFLTEYPLPTGTVLDVGANLGIVSLVLAHRYPNRTIHAFEPNPSTVQSLERNIVLNQASNIVVQDVAVGDTDGSIRFSAHPQNRGTARQTVKDTEYTQTVPCRTLDTYVQEENIGEIGLLKVDVEGYEKSVFEGAAEVLREQQACIVYFEVCPNLTRKAGFDPSAPAEMLRDFGYMLHRLSRDGKLEKAQITDTENVGLENWVAVSSPY